MTLFGIDISSWQPDINVANMALDFVIVKASGGTGYRNPYMRKHADQALSSGKLLGFYHYAHEAGCQGSAEQEAQYFLDTVQDYLGKAILVLDWESDNKTDVGWAKRFLDYVKEKTGKTAVFYTYTSVLQCANFSAIKEAGYPLWLANYGWDAATNGFRQPPLPATPYWYDDVFIFQYSSNTYLPGYGGRLDVNYSLNTREDWQALATGGNVEMKEKEIEKMEEADMTEFAFAYGNAMYYVCGQKMRVLQSKEEWGVLQAMYHQVQCHLRGEDQARPIYAVNWTDNPATFEAYCRICGYDRESEEAIKATTKGIEDIKTELGI